MVAAVAFFLKQRQQATRILRWLQLSLSPVESVGRQLRAAGASRREGRRASRANDPCSTGGGDFKALVLL